MQEQTQRLAKEREEEERRERLNPDLTRFHMPDVDGLVSTDQSREYWEEKLEDVDRRQNARRIGRKRGLHIPFDPAEDGNLLQKERATTRVSSHKNVAVDQQFVMCSTVC